MNTKFNKILIVALAAAAILSAASACFALATAGVNVKASVPSLTQSLALVVSSVDPVTGLFTSATEVNFGTLTFDSVFQIFRASKFFAIDAVVTDNSGTVWTLTHTVSAFQKDATSNIGGNVNVSFVQLLSGVETLLDKKSFTNSNNKAITKTLLGNGSLRIYYGVATGLGDDDEVTPITVLTAAGSYLGTVTLTLTP